MTAIPAKLAREVREYLPLLKDMPLYALFCINFFAIYIPNGRGEFFTWGILPIAAFWILARMDRECWTVFATILRTHRRNIALGVILFFAFLGATTLYSANPKFGFYKWALFLYDVLPDSLALLFLICKIDGRRLALVVMLIIGAACAMTLAQIVNGPFTYDGKPNFLWWTHIGYGRFLGLSFLIIVMALFNVRKNKDKSLLLAALLVVLLGLILSGLRAALLGALVLGLVILVREGRNRVILLRVLGAGAVVAVLIAVIAVTPLGDTLLRAPYTRYMKMMNLERMLHDSAIGARFDAYGFSWRMFVASPVIGHGLGSYNAALVSPHQTVTQYPHNIILETGAELGIAGLVVLGIYLWIILRKLSRITVYAVIIFLYYLWLSLFSGFLPDHRFVFGAWIVLLLPREEIARIVALRISLLRYHKEARPLPESEPS